MSPPTPKVPAAAREGEPAAEPPLWRRDFPIDVPEDQYVARREFVKFLVLTSLAFTAGQVWILARGLLRRRARAPEIEIARVDEIPVGSSVRFDYPRPGEPKILVRLSEGVFVAYDSRCTHLSCPVIPQPERGRLFCPCHSGSFDLATGRPIAGPPRRPLPKVELAVRAGRVYAVGLRERIG